MKHARHRPGNDHLFIMLLVLLMSLMIAGPVGARHPLEPLDTSSPRATFESFLAVIEETTKRFYEYRDSPSQATMAALFQMRDRFKRLLDLSEVPPAAREEVGVETIRLLWGVIARLDLPALDEIPEAVADEESEPLAHWRIPGTEITIAHVEEGSRAGEYLFSADTVERARSFYELVKELPYQRPVPLGDLSRMQQLITGWMIPMAWIETFPDWANTLILGQVLWKWLAGSAHRCAFRCFPSSTAACRLRPRTCAPTPSKGAGFHDTCLDRRTA